MSLVNWFVGPESATVVTDSLCIQAGLPVAWHPKAFIIWHAAMILVSRGPMDIGWLAMWDLAHRHYEGGIDAVETLLPGILETAYDEIVERHGASNTEVGLVGYSPRESRYRAVSFMSANGFKAELQPPGCYMSPGPPGYRPDRLEPPTDDMWIQSARQQQKVLAEETAPAWCCIGGPLFAIAMTKAGINIRKLCVLPHFEEARDVMRQRDGVRVPSPISRLVDA